MHKNSGVALLEKLLFYFWHKTWVGKNLKKVLRTHTFVSRNWVVQVKYFLLDVKNRKVDKKFMIVLMKDHLSLESAEKCRQSIRRHGGGEVEYFTAIDEHHSEAVLKKHGIDWIKLGSNRRNEKTLMGCFASHFLLWLKCIEIDEPIMVFESDALCVRALPSRLRFRHIINLADGYCRRDYLIKKEVAQFLDKSLHHGSVRYDAILMPGTVAYAISPDGARRLVKKAKTGFACEADHFVEKSTVDIVERHPLPIELNTDFPSYLERKRDVPQED